MIHGFPVRNDWAGSRLFVGRKQHLWAATNNRTDNVLNIGTAHELSGPSIAKEHQKEKELLVVKGNRSPSNSRDTMLVLGKAQYGVGRKRVQAS